MWGNGRVEEPSLDWLFSVEDVQNMVLYPPTPQQKENQREYIEERCMYRPTQLTRLKNKGKTTTHYSTATQYNTIQQKTKAQHFKEWSMLKPLVEGCMGNIARMAHLDG